MYPNTVTCVPRNNSQLGINYNYNFPTSLFCFKISLRGKEKMLSIGRPGGTVLQDPVLSGPQRLQTQVVPVREQTACPVYTPLLAARAPDPSPHGTPHLGTAEGTGVHKLPATTVS